MIKMFIDIETSSLHPGAHGEFYGEILELAIGREMDDGEYSEHVWRFQPAKPSQHDPRALEVNKYNERKDNYVLSSWETSAKGIHDLLSSKRCLYIGHNVQFDLNYLNACFWWVNLPPIPVRGIDTMTLVHEHLAPIGLNSLSLDKTRAFLGMSGENAHCALVDMRDTRAIYHKLLRANRFDRMLWEYKAKLRELRQ